MRIKSDQATTTTFFKRNERTPQKLKRIGKCPTEIRWTLLGSELLSVWRDGVDAPRLCHWVHRMFCTVSVHANLWWVQEFNFFLRIWREPCCFSLYSRYMIRPGRLRIFRCQEKYRKASVVDYIRHVRPFGQLILRYSSNAVVGGARPQTMLKSLYNNLFSSLLHT